MRRPASPNAFSPQKNSSKQGIWSSQFFRDLFQVVRRTPRDTPVPLLVRENYLPPPWRPNFGRSREGYGRYAFPVFSRIWVSTVDLGTQSSILLSGGGGRQLCVPCSAHPYLPCGQTKRAVLANVPSFRFWGVQEYQQSQLSSARVALQGKTFWRKCPDRGTSVKTTLLRTPECKPS